MEKIPYRREHTGSVSADRIQRSSQEAAQRLGEVRDAIEFIPINIVLPKAITTTRATAVTTKLGIRVRRGDTWIMEYWGRGGSSTINGMKYAVMAPTGSEVLGILHSSLGAITTLAYPQISAINTLTSAVHTVAGGTRDDYLNVRVKVVRDGLLALGFSANTAGDTATIAAKALARFSRYTEVSP